MKKLKRAFTLIELLVVIAVIALLLAILTPALQKAKESARRVQCKSNLKTIALSLKIYAEENEGKLPLNEEGNWAWDVSFFTTDLIMENGGDPKTFYCPSDPTKKPDLPELWQFSMLIRNNINPPKWMIEPEGIDERKDEFRVTGYFWLMDMEDSSLRPPIIGDKSDRWLRTYTDIRNTGQTELVLDATISTGTDRNEEVNTFVQVPGGSYNWLGVYDRTNHIKDGAKPVGGNIGYADGHVNWKSFNEMEVRINQSNMPVHWW